MEVQFINHFMIWFMKFILFRLFFFLFFEGVGVLFKEIFFFSILHSIKLIFVANLFLIFVNISQWVGLWYPLYSFSFLEGEFNWDNELQGYILGAFYWGYITTQLLGGRLAEMYGTKYLFGGPILCSSLLNLLLPVMAEWSPYAFIALRVMMGIVEVRFRVDYVYVNKISRDTEALQVALFKRISPGLCLNLKTIFPGIWGSHYKIRRS